MQKMEEKVEDLIIQINTLYNSVSKADWRKINQEGFVFELERNTKKLKNLHLDLEELNRELKMLIETNTPTFDQLLVELSREMSIIESNLSMEKTKRLRENEVNLLESREVPELYYSIQQKILTIVLRSRNSIEKVKTFLLTKDTSPIKKGTTARALMEMLQKQEDELKKAKEQNFDLKRKTFFGTGEEVNAAEVEKELHETDKNLSESISETKKSLKTHLAQLNYVEGSFIQLKNEVEKVEQQHSTFTKKSLELIKDLKKERDFARKIALEVESETITIRNSYTHQLLDFEKRKTELEEKIKQKYINEIGSKKKEIEEKSMAIVNLTKLIEEQEKEIKILKQKIN